MVKPWETTSWLLGICNAKLVFLTNFLPGGPYPSDGVRKWLDKLIGEWWEAFNVYLGIRERIRHVYDTQVKK